LEFHSARSLKQQSVGRHAIMIPRQPVSVGRHAIMIPRQPVFAYTP
jgi:hypothetical protein